MLIAEEMLGQGQGEDSLKRTVRVEQWRGVGIETQGEAGDVCSPGGSGRTKGGAWSGRVGPRGVGPGGGSHLDDSQADGAPARAEGKAASWQQ